jgi:hypothetical protein
MPASGCRRPDARYRVNFVSAALQAAEYSPDLRRRRPGSVDWFRFRL